jgi:UDP-glucuronate 4-epimerase
MTYLVTGAAGFIGFHTAQQLLTRGEHVIGLDNLNSYYSVQLKHDRLALLTRNRNFSFRKVDLADMESLRSALAEHRINRVIHLAAQAGVRYSIENPHAYVRSNIVGFVNVLEYCRLLDDFEGMCYASSSSVYGGNTKLPFAESDPVDSPISLYAASKRADELIGNVYAHLFGMPLTGLRFFTVYGPWGRPDMAMWLFAQAIMDGKPITVYNFGKMRRDFTYIDDIVTGVIRIADSFGTPARRSAGHKVYNIGNNRPENLMHMIGVLERTIGDVAEKIMLPLQPGDVPETYADIDAIQRDFGFTPRTPIEEGIPAFVEWFRGYRDRAELMSA